MNDSLFPQLQSAFEAYYTSLMEASRVGLSDVLRRDVWGAVLAADMPMGEGESALAQIGPIVDAELERRGAWLAA